VGRGPCTCRPADPLQDLSYLNRDLSKVVMLDTNAEHSALQPENAIIIKPWEGQSGDKGLVDMIPFLECECGATPAQTRLSIPPSN
jgi:TFIIF-interacting CTD phosphatase-like protein